MKICDTSSSTDRPDLPGNDRPGTLVWIGDRDSLEFQNAYHFCGQNVPQMAVRRDLAEAISRRANMVDRIIFARASRRAITAAEVSGLVATYPQATRMQLRGPMCEGDRLDHAWSGQRCRWHEWNQVLPAWLHGSSTVTAPNEGAGHVTSVAVIAASLAAADPLMDLIVSEGATAIWSPRPDAMRVRGVQSVWWDDSIAAPASESEWQDRLAKCGASSQGCKHVWLVNGPRLEASQEARRGGVSLVLGKPFRVSCLADALSNRDLEAGHSCASQRSVIAA